MANLQPQAVRALDGKGRFTVPLVLADECFQPLLCGAVVRFVADPSGTYALVDTGSPGCYRLTIPSEFRQALNLRSGTDVALARDGRDLLVWAWREAGNA